MTEKGKETLDKVKDLVKKAAGAVTPGDRGGNREYFKNLIKHTTQRSEKGPIRKYFRNLIEETTQRSEKALIRRRRTTEIKDLLNNAISRTREGVGEVDDPRGQALFETTAEVLQGLVTAYEHYDHRAEEAWQPKKKS